MSRFNSKQIVAFTVLSLLALPAFADLAQQPVPDAQEAKLIHDAAQSSAECVSAVAVAGVDVPSFIIPDSDSHQVAVTLTDPNLTAQQIAALQNCEVAINNKLASETSMGRVSGNLAKQIFRNMGNFMALLQANMQGNTNRSVDPSSQPSDTRVWLAGIRG